MSKITQKLHRAAGKCERMRRNFPGVHPGSGRRRKGHGRMSFILSKLQRPLIIRARKISEPSPGRQ
ncbi:MAG: hypothetical protein KDK33_13815, partial [Leptospiraceae bacterium]|nr:hypothetical protein [Leptospiraceae bacterium]